MTSYNPAAWNNSGGVVQSWNQPQAPQAGQPQAPNYSGFNFGNAGGAANAQQQAANYNIGQQQYYNQFSQVNPFGSQQWTVGPDGQRTLTTNVSPNQGMINAQEEEKDIALAAAGRGTLQQLGETFKNPYSFGGLQNQLPGAGDFGQDRQRIEDTLYGGFEARMAPRFQQEQEALTQRLADQGIPPDSELGQRLATQLSQRQEDARLQAQTQATQIGGNEQQRLFNMGMGARGQEIGEYNAQRYGGLSDLGQLFSQRRGFTQGQFQGQAPINVPQMDVGGLGLGYQGLANAYRIAQMNAGGGGGGGGASPLNITALAASAGGGFS